MTRHERTHHPVIGRIRRSLHPYAALLATTAAALATVICGGYVGAGLVDLSEGPDSVRAIPVEEVLALSPEHGDQGSR